MAHVLALARSAPQARDAGASTAPTDSLPPLAPGPALPSASAIGLVGDYLGQELLLMLPREERRDFALLSELPEVPRALLAAGHVAPQAARLLDQLAARRYFVEVTAGDAWRLHDLFRDALRAHNAQSDSTAELAAARRERAAWVLPFSSETAMNLLVAAADSGGALALLQQHGRAWLAQGRHHQLLTWLRALNSGTMRRPCCGRPKHSRRRSPKRRARVLHAPVRCWSRAPARPRAPMTTLPMPTARGAARSPAALPDGRHDEAGSPVSAAGRPGFAVWADGLSTRPVVPRPEGRMISDRIRQVVQRDAYSAVAGRLKIDDDTLARLAALAVARYAESRDFTVLHLVTASHAMRVLLHWLDDRSSALGHFANAFAAGWLSCGIDPQARTLASIRLDWPEVVARALRSDDEHVIKLVHSCREETTAYGGGAWLHAAALVVS